MENHLLSHKVRSGKWLENHRYSPLSMYLLCFAKIGGKTKIVHGEERIMPDNKPTHQPHHKDFFNMKGQVSDAEALNAGENLTHQIKERSITVPEADRALAIGRAMNAGTEPAMSMTPKRVFSPPKP
jgi:hypothetical protein